MRLALAPILILSSLLLAPLSAAAQCLDSGVECGEWEKTEKTAEAVFERVCFIDQARLALRQDATQGVLFAEKTGDGVNAGTVYWVDEFVIRNLAEGTVVNCSAQLLLNASTFMAPDAGWEEAAYAYMFGSLWTEPSGAEGSFDIVAAESSGSVDYPEHVAIDLPITIRAGEPLWFQASLGSIVAGRSLTRAEARLRFIGLPEGAVIESCKGFRQSTAVPARALSWGKLKSVYR